MYIYIYIYPFIHIIFCIYTYLYLYIYIYLYVSSLFFLATYTTDMKAGISVDKLVEHAEPMAAVMSIDRRGAYFKQRDVEWVFEQKSKDARYLACFLKLAAKHAYAHLGAVIKVLGYAFRVMCAHYRIKLTEYKQLTNPDEEHQYVKNNPCFHVPNTYRTYTEHLPNTYQTHTHRPFFGSVANTPVTIWV